MYSPFSPVAALGSPRSAAATRGLNGSPLRKPASSPLSRRQLVSMGLGLTAVTEIASIPQAYAASPTRTLVLVHGAWHGGWCWLRVADHLTAKGHLATYRQTVPHELHTSWLPTSNSP